MENTNWRQKIEYTNLKSPSAKELKNFVKTADNENYYGVCLLYGNLGIARNIVLNKNLKLITVAGFPSIWAYDLIKAQPAKYALRGLGMYNQAEIDAIKSITDLNEADELDIVFPFYWYVRGYLLRCTHLIAGIKKLYKKPLKVIIELGTLINGEKNIHEICSIINDSGADFVKTNTGLVNRSFDTLIDKLTMLKSFTDKPIKASGFIRTEKQVKQLIELGVTRIGTSGIKEYEHE